MDKETLAEELDLTLEETVMVKGVEFARYTDSDGKERFHLIYPSGNVETMSLSDVYPEGNYTMGVTRQGDREVMIDDDGIHTNWD